MKNVCIVFSIVLKICLNLIIIINQFCKHCRHALILCNGNIFQCLSTHRDVSETICNAECIMYNYYCDCFCKNRLLGEFLIKMLMCKHFLCVQEVMRCCLQEYKSLILLHMYMQVLNQRGFTCKTVEYTHLHAYIHTFTQIVVRLENILEKLNTIVHYIIYMQIIQYSTLQYSTVHYSIVQYSTVQYSTVQYSTVQYSTVKYSTVQYITVQ